MSIFNFGVIGVIFLSLFQYLVNPYFLRPPYKVIKLVFSKHMHATIVSRAINCQIFLTRDSKCTCTNVVFPDPAIPRHKMHVGFSFWNSELAASSPLSSNIDGPAKELLSPPLACAILELGDGLIRHVLLPILMFIAGSTPYQYLSIILIYALQNLLPVHD